MSFTKWNFIMTIIGIVSFLFDIGVDLWISFKYFQQELYLFGLLTIFFAFLSTLIVQAFSYTWFKDDFVEGSDESMKCILVIHLFLAGTLLRYWYAVKHGYRATYDQARDRENAKKKAVFDMTDLSMLRCFKTYLENISIVASIVSISWSTVDYQTSLRKSLPGQKGISVGLPLLSYTFYKFFTLTSWIVSIVFLLTCNIYIFAGLVTLLAVAGFCWAWKQDTDFCKTKRMESLYRAVVGIILVFTFFNVKGSKTRIPISVYYSVRCFFTSGILTLCFFLRPAFARTFIFAVLSIATVVTLGLGILSLILYYACFHPTLHCLIHPKEDTVDGIWEDQSRLTNFIMP
ncbi:unnamed protein product [Ranitomeya imitator]|uniref:XK-related protein n=1 Tax=Ranitomeya imitator TaxID=111125 RepID=A0ABN9ML36_9NEOB|nr:unnamed protein product [Ranitomeya imitator]